MQYWKLTTELNHYWPIGKGFVLYLDGQVGYGKTYGKNGISDSAFGALAAASKADNPDQNHVITDMRQDLPFWQNYYAGGVRDVRGFQDNTLGPRVCIDGSIPDAKGMCNAGAYYAQPVGGAFKVLGTAQMFLPLPFLKDVNTARVSWFMDVGNVYKDYKSFNASDLRASTGLSLQWQAPIGPLIISLAMPFRSKDADRHYEERIQFTFGSQF